MCWWRGLWNWGNCCGSLRLGALGAAADWAEDANTHYGWIRNGAVTEVMLPRDFGV
jgi:hypothetical protein